MKTLVGTHRRTVEVLAEGFVDYFRTHPGERERVEHAAPERSERGEQDEAAFFTGG